MWRLDRIRQLHLEKSSKIYEEIERYKTIIERLEDDDKNMELLCDQAIWLLKEDSNTEALDGDTTIAEKIKYSMDLIEKLKKLNKPHTLLPIYIIENGLKEIKLIYSATKQTTNEDFDEDFQLIKQIYLSTKDVYSLVAIYNITESLFEYIRLLVELVYTGSNIIVSIDNEVELICSYLEEIQMEIREIFNFLDCLRIKLEDM